MHFYVCFSRTNMTNGLPFNWGGAEIGVVVRL